MAHYIPPIALTGSPWHGVLWPDFDPPEPSSILLTPATRGCKVEDMSTRTADEILAVLDEAQGELNQHFEGRFDLRGLLWEVIEDVRSSYGLAIGGACGDFMGYHPDVLAEIEQTVEDYLVNNYGDD